MGATIHKFPKQPAPKAAPAKREAANAVNFTDAQVRTWLRNPPPNRPEFQDASDPKLRARVSPGLVAFSLYQWNPQTKKPKRWTLGRITSGTAPETTIAAIRKQAAILKGDVASGKETAARAMEGMSEVDQATAASGMTCAELVAEYCQNRRRAGRALAPKSCETYQENMRRLLGKHYTQPIAKLTPELVVRLYRAMIEKRDITDANGKTRTTGNPGGAFVAVACLAAICRRHDLPNVTRLLRKRDEIIKPAPRNSRLGQVDAVNLCAWAWDAAKREPHTATGTVATMILLATVMGWRRGTVQALTWAMLDWKAGTVSLPDDVLKGRRAYVLPMPPRMLALLKARQAGSDSELVFTNPSKRGRFELGVSMLSYLPFAISAHDGRKAFAMALVKVGAGVLALKYLMTHSTHQDVTLENYILTNTTAEIVAEVRPTIEAVEAYMLAKVGDAATLAAMEKAAKDHRRTFTHGKARNRATREANRKQGKA